MESIGEKIYNLRKQKSVSQEKLAEKLGVSRQTVSKWETNAMQPSMENLKYLCEFFGVESAYFFDENEAITLPDTAVTEKETTSKTINILITVAGLVLLALCIIACGIAAYVTISPNESGVWTSTSHSVDYAGIIFLAVGIVALAVFITFVTLIIIKRKKRAKRTNCKQKIAKR